MAAEPTSLIFTSAFLAAVVLSTGLKIWLSTRQMRHVASNRSTVPSQFQEKIKLSSHQRAADYTLARHQFGLLTIAVEVVVLITLTMLGGLQWLYELTQSWFGADLATISINSGTQAATGASVALGSFSLWSSIGPVLCFVVLVTSITSLIDLPLDWYRQFVIEERFGFNRMTVKAWLKDGLTGTLVAALLGLPLLAVVVWLMKSAGQSWWLWAWAVWVLFSLSVMIIFPVWIAPLFNKFEPLAQGQTRSRVESLLARCGFSSNGLFVMDGSKRSSHGNAYFTGIGKKKRIVFFDTLLSRLSDDEVEAVLAHELGHFKHKHVLKRLIMSFVLSFLGFAFLGWVMQQPWFYQGLGMSPDLNQAQGPALVLFMLALPVFMFPLHPLGSFFSRKDEFQADRFAAQTSSADNLVQALVKLYDDNASTLTPDPVYSAFYDSHPPAMVRIQKLLEQNPPAQTNQDPNALSHS
jgi:STE24 endopeptidase